jgi:Tat protein secretion system quality control protein TatD with DNase activity
MPVEAPRFSHVLCALRTATSCREAQECPNRPANIVYNLRAAAEILGIPEEEIAAVSTANAVRIFNLKI